MLSVDSNQPITHDIFINNLKTALSSCRHLLLAEYLEQLVFHCSNTCRVDLVAIMEVVWFCVLGYIGVLYLTAIKEALAKVVKEQRYIRYTHMLFYFGV